MSVLLSDERETQVDLVANALHNMIEDVLTKDGVWTCTHHAQHHRDFDGIFRSRPCPASLDDQRMEDASVNCWEEDSQARECRKGSGEHGGGGGGGGIGQCSGHCAAGDLGP